MQRALITSFSTQGFETSFSVWREGVGIDLYCFLHRDKLPKLDIARREPKEGAEFRKTDDLQFDEESCSNALDYLSQIVNDDKAMLKVAQSILRKKIGNAEKAPIVALTSFLPEISQDDPDPEASKPSKASRAVAALYKLARVLRANGEKQLHVIEVVGGSRVQGLWRGRPETMRADLPKQTYFAIRKKKTEAIRALALALESSLRLACPKPDDELAIALELEPGPLYVLNDLSSISRCIAKIDRKYRSYVGLCLDIAHWHLACIKPDEVPPRLKQRIIHAHISDHSKGHFGDLPVGDLGFELSGRGSTAAMLTEFEPWMKLLKEVWEKPRPNNLPLPSRYISVELEAASSMESVNRSLRRLDRLLARQ